jgi:hypothetical protein
MAVLKPESDRRSSRRIPLDELPEITGVKVQSQEVKGINASREGILIECSLRLPPGTATQLEILRTDGPRRVRGRVVRCEIMSVSADRIRYRIAIALSDRLDFIDDELKGLPGTPALVTDGVVVDTADVIELDTAMALNSW